MGSAIPPDVSLLSSYLDHLAATEPSRLLGIHPVTPDLSKGWRKITMEEMSRAVNYMAHWIDSNVAPGSGTSETLAYMGANDIRYAVFVLACVKMGHVSLLLSTRNSEHASLHVLQKTECSKFIYSPERERQVRALQGTDSKIQAWQAPDLWDMFDQPSAPYPSKERKFEDIEDDAAIIIHSSGTTGLPKPVPLTHGYIGILLKLTSFPFPPGRCSSLVTMVGPGELTFSISPLFHFMGLLVIFMPIAHGTPFVLGPEKPLTAELLAQIVSETEPKTTSLPPSILEDLSNSELGRATLAKFKYIASGSAALPPEVGDKICKITHLQTVLGSSECGIVNALKVEDREDWEYMEWNPFYATEMRDVGDGYFELVIPSTGSKATHCVFHACPGITEFKTGDLFVPHPTKQGLWKYAGRRDDLIVLSNGEKFNPTAMEEVILEHPLVSRVAVIGQGRFQAALLVEPHWDKLGENIGENELIEEIWPSVQKANDAAPGHARLMKTKIGVASRDKPFKITAKGSTQRYAVVADYSQEIDALYSDANEGEEVVLDFPESATTAGDIAPYIKSVLLQLLPVKEQDINEDSDIFALGLDSLQTLRLGQILRSAACRKNPELSGSQAFSSQQLYGHPSISKLAQYLLDVINGENTVTESATTVVEDEATRAARLSALVEKHTSGMGESHSIILTGSTGSLGTYLLHELLQDSSVEKVYCLNRSEDAGSRQVHSFQEKGLSSSEKPFGTRVEFYQAKLSDEKLGLDNEVYDRLLQSVDTIIHNAWKVNFNHRVEAFEDPHISGVRKLIDFSIASQRRAHVHFISSISTIEGWQVSKRGPSIPEEIFEDADVVMQSSGYGESKHVSERICKLASERCGVPTSIHRVGQIGGPTTEKGMWNKQEWLPSLVATSKTLKQIPSSLGSVSVQWIPVDSTARIITDTVRTRRTTQATQRCAAFHLVNPRVSEWSSLIPAVRKHFPFIETVEGSAWLAALEKCNENATPSDLVDKPGLKILDFFRGVFATTAASTNVNGEKGGSVTAPVTETIKTQEASQTMRELKPIDEEIMDTWMKQWNF